MSSKKLSEVPATGAPICYRNIPSSKQAKFKTTKQLLNDIIISIIEDMGPTFVQNQFRNERKW
jgi:hypothetical protein